MVEEIKSLNEDTHEAVGRLAAGYKFAKGLVSNLEKVEHDEPDQALKDVRKGLHLLRWVGRAERRIDQSEKKILTDLEELKELGLPKELQTKSEDLQTKLSIAEGELVEFASLFRGKLKKELEDIRTEEALLKEYEDDPKKAEKIHAHLISLIKDSEEEVAHLIKWMNSTQAIFREIMGFEEVLEKLTV